MPGVVLYVHPLTPQFLQCNLLRPLLPLNAIPGFPLIFSPNDMFTQAKDVNFSSPLNHH